MKLGKPPTPSCSKHPGVNQLVGGCFSECVKDLQRLVVDRFSGQVLIEKRLPNSLEFLYAEPSGQSIAIQPSKCPQTLADDMQFRGLLTVLFVVTFAYSI